MLATKTVTKFSVNQLFSNLKSCFSKPNKSLKCFYDVAGNRSIQASHYEGKKLVSLSQIVGSMNASRCQDFDADFKLLAAHSQERLAGVAAASQTKALPPISLVKLGNSFFVQDGHHRVSIALSNGQNEIMAAVTAVTLETNVAPAQLSPASA